VHSPVGAKPGENHVGGGGGEQMHTIWKTGNQVASILSLGKCLTYPPEKLIYLLYPRKLCIYLTYPSGNKYLLPYPPTYLKLLIFLVFDILLNLVFP
jgi:hypothetical protein